MARLSASIINKKIGNINVYDLATFLYVLAMFVFENDTYSQLFSVIQIIFVAVSLFYTVGRGFIRKSAAYPWALLMTVLAFVLAFTYDTVEVWSTIQIFVRNMIRILLLTLYLKNTSSYKKLISYIAVSGVVCGFFLVGEFLSSEIVYSDLRYATNSRVGASIAGGNVNVVSMYMGFAFAACLYLANDSKERRKSLLFLGLGVFVVATSLFTGSRKILYFYVVVYALYNASRGAKYLITFFAVMAVAYLALMNIEPLYYLVGHKVDFFSDSATYALYGESDEERKYAALGGLRTFLENPLGIGFGNSYNYIGIYAHNNFVEVLMDGGLIGFVIYYWVYVRALLLHYRNRNKNQLSKFIFVTTVGLLLLEINQVTYLYSIPVVYLAIMLNSDVLVEEHERGFQEKFSRGLAR